MLFLTSVQSHSHVRLFATPWTAAHQASLSITSSRSLHKIMSIESVMPSNHFILSCPLFLLPSIFPSIRVFSNESALRIRWPKYWSFSLNTSPSNEHPGLISFGMDWLDLLAVQGTLKSLLQHRSPKASILWRSAFFIVLISIVLVLGLMNMLLWHKKALQMWLICDCEMGSITWILQVSPTSLSRSFQEGGWKLRSRYWVDVMREAEVRVMWGAGHEQRNAGGI